jgi:thiosulfate/3-mercaptopyruvate sulfurtransferase
MNAWPAVFAIAAAALAWPVAAQQAPAPDTLIVSPAWVAQHLHDPDLVLLHVGSRATYDAGHIPGARFADVPRAANSGPERLTLEMPDAAALHDALENLGISDKSHVVVYASDQYFSHGTRLLLTLDYAGLAKVSYLDGGLTAWKNAGHPVSSDAPPNTKGSLAPLTLRPVVVDAAFVQQHQQAPGFAIVDARAAVFYNGEQPGGQRGQPQKFGHIPGAVSAPFGSFASGDGQLKPASEIKAVFDTAGVKPGDTVIGYCHIGQQATAMLLAARTLGHPILLYDGSFEDWNRRNLPLEVPKKQP